MKRNDYVQVLKKKTTLGFVFLFSVIIVFTIIKISDTKSTNIQNYLATGSNLDEEAKHMMLTLENLPKYKDIDYKYTNKRFFFFESHSVVLSIQYNDETYKSEKENLEETYKFLNTKKIDFKQNGALVPPYYEFSVNTYTFRIVKDVKDYEGYSMGYHKSFGLIGSSNEKKRIAYLYFYDFDLDVGEDNMEQFVKQYFDYEF